MEFSTLETPHFSDKLRGLKKWGVKGIVELK